MANVLSSVLRMLTPSETQFAQVSTLADTLATQTGLSANAAAGKALAITAASAGDIGILNYALTLEHFEAVLYRTIIASGLLTNQQLTYAMAYGAHENTHVTALTDTITKLGGTPAREQSAYYLPAVKTAQDILDLMVTVEDVGASAYLGAAPLIQDAGLLTVAVQIHTVEAEHATVWRALDSMNTVPFDFATPRTSNEVLTIVTPFLQPIHAYLPLVGN